MNKTRYLVAHIVSDFLSCSKLFVRLVTVFGSSDIRRANSARDKACPCWRSVSNCAQFRRRSSTRAPCELVPAVPSAALWKISIKAVYGLSRTLSSTRKDRQARKRATRDLSGRMPDVGWCGLPNGDKKRRPWGRLPGSLMSRATAVGQDTGFLCL